MKRLIGILFTAILILSLIATPAYAIGAQTVYVKSSSDRTLWVDKTTNHSTFLKQYPGTTHTYYDGSEGKLSSNGLYFWVNSRCALKLYTWYKTRTYYTNGGVGYWIQFDANGYKITAETFC